MFLTASLTLYRARVPPRGAPLEAGQLVQARMNALYARWRAGEAACHGLPGCRHGLWKVCRRAFSQPCPSRWRSIEEALAPLAGLPRCRRPTSSTYL